MITHQEYVARVERVQLGPKVDPFGLDLDSIAVLFLQVDVGTQGVLPLGRRDDHEQLVGGVIAHVGARKASGGAAGQGEEGDDQRSHALL